MVERPLVLDASVMVAWCFPDEATPATEALRDRVSVAGAVVPPHWRIEVENTIRAGERRGKATPEEVQAFVELIRVAPVDIDISPLATFGTLLPLARLYSLSVYDAAYIELANRRGLPLATLDANMRRAAQVIGIDLVDVT